MQDHIAQVLSGIQEVNSGVSALLPELILLFGIIFFLVLDFFSKPLEKLHRILAFGFTATLLYTIYLQFSIGEFTFLSGSFTLTAPGIILKLIFILAYFCTSVLFHERDFPLRSSIKNVLLLTIVLGGNLMVMSSHYITMFLSIEMVSIPSYMLVALRNSKAGVEAGIKYLLFGAVSTAILLYGISLLYGFTGTMEFSAITGELTIALIIMVFFVLLGLLFKMGMVPMHLWLPDIYEATVPSIVAFFSVVPKLAGVGLLLLWLKKTDLWGQPTIALILSAAVVASLVVGTFSAIWQKSPKRMLGYAAIAQSGFILMALLTFGDFGIAAMLFYAVVYLITTYLAFYILYLMESRNMHSIAAMAGQVANYPWIAVTLVLVMISFTGLPPTAGFSAKLLVFSALVSGLHQGTFLVVLIVGMLSTVVSLYFYLKIPYFMVFKPSFDLKINYLPLSIADRAILASLSFLILFLFIKSDFLLNFINTHIFVS